MKSANILIREETPKDIPTITDVTVEAFKSLAISNQTEHLIVDALRSANVLTISLVAELEGEIVGHIAFSPVSISDGSENWYGLGPVSVLPEHQRKGIGTALIKEGLIKLQELGGKGCCLVGHPDYYPRFGFRNIPELNVEGVPPEAFFAISFDDRYPSGTVTFHDAFLAGI